MLKKLSNKGETKVFDQVSPIADRYGASVYRKIRIADVIDIDRLNIGSLGSYALKAHYDFVVADESENPLFAIEFDGPGHTTDHDAKKDEISRRADLALFRVDLQSSRIETAHLTFLEYMTHLWFLARRFEEMRAAGTVPPDEPFMISGFLKPDAKHIFDSEFDLLGSARGKLVRFCKKNNLPGGPLWHLHLAEALMAHDDGSYVAFSSFPLNGENLFGRATINLKIPHWGKLAEVAFASHEIGQFCTALAIEDVVEELRLHQSGAGHVLRMQRDVMEEINALKHRGYRTLLAGYGSDKELFEAAW
jgi:hypothetical protein